MVLGLLDARCVTPALLARYDVITPLGRGGATGADSRDNSGVFMLYRNTKVSSCMHACMHACVHACVHAGVT